MSRRAAGTPPWRDPAGTPSWRDPVGTPSWRDAAETPPWRDPAVVAFAAAVVLGVGQALAAALGRGGFGVTPTTIVAGTVPYAAALGVLLVVRAGRDAPRWRHDLDVWLVGLAVFGSLLATWLLVRFAVSLPQAVGAEFGFYRLKGRITSPLGDHNTAAGLLLPPLVATAVLAASRPRWAWAGGVVALGLVATLSRGVAAVLAIVVVAAFVLASRVRVAVVLTAAFGVVVLGLTAAMVGLDTSVPPGTAAPGPATQAGAGPLGASVLGRIDLAVRGVGAGADRPLTGVGLGGFASVAQDLPQPNDHAHQAFANAFAEGGVPLLLAVLVVVVTLAVRAARLPRSPRRDLVLLGGLGLVAHAQLEILAGRLGHEVLLAALVGLAVVPGTSRARAGQASGTAGGPAPGTGGGRAPETGGGPAPGTGGRPASG
ncbi:O-antigen ligase family protein [Egicoccus sp. AB-alg6-2]|uniref:O-antigen ligase family protein n=1 Tax=Egicoccus sp. AB-alg6-2 TaxID=3242692 RepID=UPI00359CBA8C